MLATLRILALVIRFSGLDGCEVADWGLDDVRDSGADSIGVQCGSSQWLVGPDWLADQIGEDER